MEDAMRTLVVKKTGEAHPAQEGPVLHPRSPDASDPVRSSPDGQWWFWDETWSSLHGPFGSEGQADQVLAAYAAQL